MNTSNNEALNAMRDDDTYSLASLAAQLMSRQSSPANAIRTALDLLEHAREALGEAELFAPEKLAALDTEWKQRRAAHLANARLTYEKGVRYITGIVGRWDGEYGALNWFKRFVLYKIKSNGCPSTELEPRVEAHLAKYRSNGFSGTEAEKLRAEYEHFRNKGTQGRVRKRGSDRRLKPVKEKLVEKGGKQVEKKQAARAQMAKREWGKMTGSLIRPDLKFVADLSSTEAEEVRKGKVRARHGETLVRDKDAPETLRGSKTNNSGGKTANPPATGQQDCEPPVQQPQIAHD